MNETRNQSNFCADAVRGEQLFGWPSYVYFAAVRDAIKIGFSTQPYIRQGQLHPQTRDLWMIGITPGTEDDEKALHRQFAHLRADLYGEREWFYVAPDLVQFIDGLEASRQLIPWVVYARRMRRRHTNQPPYGSYRKSVQLLHGVFPHVEYLGGLDG